METSPLHKPGIEGNFLNLIEYIYQRNNNTLKVSSINKTLKRLYYTVLEVLAWSQAAHQANEIKYKRLEKEETIIITNNMSI